MKIGAQRLVAHLEAALQPFKDKLVVSGLMARVELTKDVAEDILIVMRIAAKQDEGLMTRVTKAGPWLLIAWLRNEVASYKAMAGEMPLGTPRHAASAFAMTCKVLAEDLEQAITAGKGEPIDHKMPRRWCRSEPGRSPGAGRPMGDPLYGVYCPTTDLCVSDMGARGTGKPLDVEWIDPEP